MANLKDLIVNGSARVLGTLYANIKGDVDGNAKTATYATTAGTASNDGNGDNIITNYANKSKFNKFSDGIAQSVTEKTIKSTDTYIWLNAQYNTYFIYCHSLNPTQFQYILLPSFSEAANYVGFTMNVYYTGAPNSISFSDLQSVPGWQDAIATMPPGDGFVSFVFTNDGWVCSNPTNAKTFDENLIKKKVWDIKNFEIGRYNSLSDGSFTYLASSDSKYQKYFGNNNIINVSDLDKIYIKHSIRETFALLINYYTYASSTTTAQSFVWSKGESRDIMYIKPYEYCAIDVSNYQGVRISICLVENCPDFKSKYNFEVFIQKKPYFKPSPLKSKALSTAKPTEGNSTYTITHQGSPRDITNPSGKWASTYSTSTCNNYFDIGNGTFEHHGSYQADKAFIRGLSRDATEIADTTGVYPYAAATFSEGFISDITFHVTTGNVYACHIDYNEAANKTVIYRNCDFISDVAHNAIGIGMKNGQHIIFENCRFIASAPAFVHDANPSNSATSGGLQYITFDNCQFITHNGYVPLQISACGNNTNTFIMTFINNTFYSEVVGNSGLPGLSGRTTEGHLCGTSIYLGDASHGNNIDLLNAY